MKLENPFSPKTRLLYLYCYACFKCGRSDQGLELHHITGRTSNSPLNAFLICHHCHTEILHTQEVERELFLINYKFLLKEGYKETEEDIDFLSRFPYLIKQP